MGRASRDLTNRTWLSRGINFAGPRPNRPTDQRPVLATTLPVGALRVRASAPALRTGLVGCYALRAAQAPTPPAWPTDRPRDPRTTLPAGHRSHACALRALRGSVGPAPSVGKHLVALCPRGTAASSGPALGGCDLTSWASAPNLQVLRGRVARHPGAWPSFAGQLIAPGLRVRRSLATPWAAFGTYT